MKNCSKLLQLLRLYALFHNIIHYSLGLILFIKKIISCLSLFTLEFSHRMLTELTSNSTPTDSSFRISSSP